MMNKGTWIRKDGEESRESELGEQKQMRHKGGGRWRREEGGGMVEER